jgi:hypothetical protein
MKPGEKGWLKEYLEFRKELLKTLSAEGKKSAHPEHSLYRVIQPTGLMYGQAIHTIDHPDASKWDEKDRMKILLAESLISSSLLYYDKSIKSAEELSEVIMKTIEHIGNFYNNIFPELATPSKTLFGRKKTPLELAERILDKRIEYAIEYKQNFWSHFFHNSLLFLDIFIFGQWIHTNADRIVSEFFKYEREELRFSVIKVIALAAHANTHIAPEERKLLEYFLQGTGLPAERRKEAVRIFEQGVLLEEINLPTNNSWILKKYFLEMALLTLWADKKVEGPEEDFLRKFCRHLDFNDDDLENSMIAMEGFVLEHWEELEMLQNKQDYQQVSEKFIERLARLASKNKIRLIREVQESDELMQLLTRARGGELSESDKERMHQLLLMVLQTMPTFAIISLPQHFLTLPILMKILPQNFFSETLEKKTR